MQVRVRFAPSPTGSLHLGSVRSALFNWLYAQKEQGVFLLRIEDTDRERLVPEALEQIKASLQWLGLQWDEGPHLQSDRLEQYVSHSQELLKKGALYPCWCSPARLAELRQAAQKAGKPFKYDRHCLENSGDISQPHVLRFRVPAGKEISWEDEVRGHLSAQSKEQDDFVCLKSDGYPTYNFANVVDDHLMEITHVIRGEEFIASTPKHLLVYAAFGWAPPKFAHVPPVLGPDKAKLSKRHGAKSALDYRDLGYLPEALINFLALLGWNEGEGSTQEIYSPQQLTAAFSLNRIQKSPAVFDPGRLDWMNGYYLRQLTAKQLDAAAQPHWPKAALSQNAIYRHAVLGLVQERLKYLAELPELTDFFFVAPLVGKVRSLLGEDKQVNQRLAWAAQQARDCESWQLEQLESLFSAARIQEALGEKRGPLFSAMRIALTGRTEAPGLLETMTVLGKQECLSRLQAVL